MVERLVDFQDETGFPRLCSGVCLVLQCPLAPV
jgi:hypothetical protein